MPVPLTARLALRARRLRMVATVALLAVVLVACKDDLYSGLTQRDANEMMAVLAGVGIPASRDVSENGSYVLRVDKEHFPAAIKKLSEHGYPRDKFRTVGELFPGTSMIVSPFEQRTRYIYALNQELTQTVSEFEGVVNARVHVALPDRDASLVATPVKPSASVVIHYRPEAHPEQLSAHARNVVATAVPGLDARSVSVAMVPAKGTQRTLPASGSTQSLVPARAATVSDAGGGGQGWLRTILAYGAIIAGILGLIHMVRGLMGKSNGTTPPLDLKAVQARFGRADK